MNTRAPTLALLFLTALAGAQDATVADAVLRSRVSGAVLNLEGKAWAGAAVKLVSLPMPAFDGSGPADVVETETDARGQFRVSLLRRRVYSAWALAARGDGKAREFRITELAEGVTTGGRIALRESERGAFASDIRFAALQSWDDRKPFRAQVVLGAANKYTMPLRLDAEHHATLPPLPGRECVVELFDKNGVPLVISTQKLPGKRSKRVTAIRVPNKRVMRIEIRDITTGKGIPGATIMRNLRGAMIRVGTADKEGVARLPIPAAWRMDAYFAQAKGYGLAPLQAGVSSPVRKKVWKPLDADDKAGSEKPAHVNLGKGLHFVGRVVVGGKPASGVMFLIRGTAMHFAEENSRFLGFYNRLVRTDDDGRFEIAGMLAEPEWRSRLGIVLRREHVLALPETWQRQIHYQVHDLHDLSVGATDKVTQIGTIDLRALCPVMFEITDPDGRPAANVELAIVDTQYSAHVRQGDRHFFRTDPGGRVCILTRSDRTTVVMISGDGSSVARRVRVRRIRSDESLAFLRLKLERYFTISGRVMTAKKKPVRGMWLNCGVNRHQHGVVKATDVDDGESGFGDARGNAAVATKLTPKEHQHLLRTMIAQAQVTTDNKGRFSFEVPRVPQSFRISGRRTVLGFFKQKVSEVVEVEDKSVTDLEFVVK